MELKIDTAQAIELAKKDVDSLASHSRITVNSQPTFEQAKGQLIILKTVKKNLTAKKDSVVKPLNEALKNVRALFKPIEEKVETIEKYLNGEILKYNQRLLADQRKREEEAAEKMRAEA